MRWGVGGGGAEGVVCAMGIHTVPMPTLLFRTPAFWEMRMAEAACSDPEAQRWLGWGQTEVVSGRERERLLAKRPSRYAVSRARLSPMPWNLIAIDRAARRYAGLVSLNPKTWELGGWLRPDYRGRGLGGELFAAGLEFGHRHAGIACLRAVTEVGNAACVGALRSAGFVPAPGPGDYELPDGRIVPACWFDHRDTAPVRCGVPPPP